MSYDKFYLKLTTVPSVDNLSPEDAQFKLFKKKYMNILSMPTIMKPSLV